MTVFKKLNAILSLLAMCIGASICQAQTFLPQESHDDGTELNRLTWFEDGLKAYRNYLGRRGNDCFDAGFRYRVTGISPHDKVAFARLKFASFGGTISTSAKLIIQGLLTTESAPFSQERRPSLVGKGTRHQVVFEVKESWGTGYEEVPLFYYTPDISPIINELLDQPGLEAKDGAVSLRIRILDDSEPGKDNFIVFDDLYPRFLKSPTALEIKKTVYDAFEGKEFLGRVTDHSAAVKLLSLIATDTYIEFGYEPGHYEMKTAVMENRAADTPIVHTMDGLEGDKRVYYRLAYRKAGEIAFEKGEERSFHTQRIRGEAFSFAVQADEHLQSIYRLPRNEARLALYAITLENIAATRPDFFISMGDFAQTEFHRGRIARDFKEAKERYLDEREMIDRVAHSVPFYLVLGNHEGEQAWYLGTGEEKDGSLAAISLRARKETMLNPRPYGFYKGNEEEEVGIGFRENYYAWEWGDALFVVLDPFFRTMHEPNSTKNGWDWTLGKTQYDWLFETLHESKAKWKIVCIHHLTSTAVNDHVLSHYGRGGIEIAKFKVDGRPSFEWGGENEEGEYVFETMRPGWSHGSVHDMLVAEGASLVLHGHDHGYAMQELDGLVYQECPQPSNARYTKGALNDGKYKNGIILESSGFLLVTVTPETLRVDYIRSFLPGDGENGSIAHSYTLER